MYRTSTILPMVPKPRPERPPGAGMIEQLLNWTLWVGIAIAVAGFLISGIWLIFAAMSEHTNPQVMKRLGYVFVGCIILGAAASLTQRLI